MISRKRASLATVALLAALLPALMGPTGGYPARPTFQSVGVGGPASAAAGELVRLRGPASGGANTAYVRFQDSAAVSIGYVGDAGGAENDMYLAATVSGANINLTTIGTGSVLINGVNVTPTTTTATGTITGCTTAPTTTFRYVRIGNLVTGSVDNISCTSNATSMTFTGAVPSAMQPARTQTLVMAMQDNTTDFIGVCQVSAGSSTFVCTKTGGLFTAAGTKGFVSTGDTFSYTLN